MIRFLISFFEALFFLILYCWPVIAAFVWFIVSLLVYLRTPGNHEKKKRRRLLLMISAVVSGVLILLLMVLAALLMIAVRNM